MSYARGLHLTGPATLDAGGNAGDHNGGGIVVSRSGSGRTGRVAAYGRCVTAAGRASLHWDLRRAPSAAAGDGARCGKPEAAVVRDASPALGRRRDGNPDPWGAGAVPAKHAGNAA